MRGEELLEFVKGQFEKLEANALDIGLKAVSRDGLVIFITFIAKNNSKEYLMKCTYHDDDRDPVVGVSFVNPQNPTEGGNQFWPSDKRTAIKNTNNHPFVCIPGVYEYHFVHHQGAPVLRHHLSLDNTVSDIIALISR